MGGICAVIAVAGDPVDDTVLDAMRGAAPHRSSAGARRHVADGGAVASTISIGESDTQAPHVDPATDVVTVVHARIDNAAHLLRVLGDDGPPPGAGPAALVGAAYRRWGEAAFARLLGDFACLVWDRRRDRVLLARDPMAMRPLYYRLEARRLLVASEVKQLLAVPGVPSDPDERTVAAYLSGSFADLGWSYYAGVAQVPPSHVVVVQGRGPARVRRYWDADPDHTIEYGTEEEYAEHLRELYLDAVRVRLAGQRPAGVLLSGGIDSGAAASAAGWLREREGLEASLYSYSWDFGSLTQCDERHVSRYVVERFGLAARDIPVEDAGPLAGYPGHAPDLDDPFHGHFQTMLDRGIARAAADGVGPLFTGMRGDLGIGPVDADYESLLAGGRLVGLAGELRTHHRATGEGLAELARREVLPAADRAARRSTAASLLRWALRRSSTRPSLRAGDSTPAPPWMAPAFARRVGIEELMSTYAETPAPSLRGPLRRRRYEWLFMPMHLRWAVSHERRVAGFGMEAVDAWSDRRIAEFCLAVPQQVIQRPGEIEKRLARRALRGIAPPGFLAEAGKIVPGPLYRRTLRTTAVPTVRHLLADSRAASAGWIDPVQLRGAYERALAGGPLHPQIWWALSLEWWLRIREDTGAHGRFS